jgi:hypothetical protein
MPRPSEREFLEQVLETLKDLPPGLAQRLVEALGTPEPDRAQAIRRVFEELAGE